MVTIPPPPSPALVSEALWAACTPDQRLDVAYNARAHHMPMTADFAGHMARWMIKEARRARRRARQTAGRATDGIRTARWTRVARDWVQAARRYNRLAVVCQRVVGSHSTPGEPA